ncbi:LOW QUALITY PROTEIN: hypothetical protein M8C21_029876, partial [Ambrosia artemisiifolia]
TQNPFLICESCGCVQPVDGGGGGSAVVVGFGETSPVRNNNKWQWIPFRNPFLSYLMHVIQTTADFKPQLTQLKNTLDSISPIIVDIQNHNKKLGATKLEQEMFVHEIQDAEKLVYKCLTIKWNFFKRFTHSLRLKDVNQKLLRFFQIEVQAVQCRDIKTTLEEVNHVGERITSLALEVNHLGQALDSGTSDRTLDSSDNRKKLGWPVPPVPRGIVGFDEPLKNLKARILSDINIHDDGSSMDSDVCKVVVVSAAGGSGKTTLVKMLGNDSQIQDNFQENVFFVTVSETPDFIASVNDLFNPNRFDRQAKFQGIEDAKNKLENFFREKVSGPILVVLDDVWDESYIENFEFDIKGYKLLVTSRMRFPKYEVFKFNPLSDEHAKILFRNSARPVPTIDKNLVDQMVKCCKNHPLTLSVVGGSLNGKNEVAWKFMLKSLSQGHSVLDLNQDLNQKVLDRLERSFEALEDEFKQCFLDFGLFLEDQSILANALLDMWVHLYNHDDEGVDTLAKIYELSYRNLVDFEIFRDERLATISYCTYQSVTQHDLLRQLAIILSSKLPVAKRRRLIISEQNGLLVTNVQGKHQMALVEETQEPMQARILSISTGESFSSRWCNMRVPEVEVLVLNLRLTVLPEKMGSLGGLRTIYMVVPK